MRFDLTDLRLFANIHAAGTITAGAEATHMTLASASERILAMESSLGVDLLVRQRRGVALTAAGRVLLHHTRRILMQVEQLQAELGDLGQGIRGHVRILCNSSALSEHLPVTLSEFLARHPGISIDLEERPSTAIADALRHDLCDIGVAADSVDLEGLDRRPFRADPLALIVPLDHPLASRGRLAFRESLDLAFVGLTEGSALQAHLAEQARRLGRRLAYRIRLGSFEAVCRVVGQGTGVGVVPAAVAQRCARGARIRLLPLTDDWARRTLMICTRAGAPLTQAARELVDFLVAGSGIVAGAKPGAEAGAGAGGAGPQRRRPRGPLSA